MNVFEGPWNSAAFHQYVRQACEDFAHRPEFQDITRLVCDGIVREDGGDICTAAHCEVVHGQFATCPLVCRNFFATIFSVERGLCCAIATNLQRSCFAWASCVDGGAGHTRRSCSRLPMLRLQRETAAIG